MNSQALDNGSNHNVDDDESGVFSDALKGDHRVQMNHMDEAP